VAAPCATVLYRPLDPTGVSAYGAEAWTAARASGPRCRFRPVAATGLGWTVLAVMPSLAQWRAASTANRALAVLGWP
jgi:hypothetical protein